MSREKKREKKATVERKVQSTSKVVKMNQPWRCSVSCHPETALEYILSTDHQVKTKLVIESIGTCSHELSLDVKAPWCEYNGKRDPETSIR